MTLWKTSITSKLLEIGNSFFHTRRARLRGVFLSNKAKRSHLTVMTLWFWQVDVYIYFVMRLGQPTAGYARNINCIIIIIYRNIIFVRIEAIFDFVLHLM